MSAQLKTRLAVRGSSRMMAEKVIDWETIPNFEFTVMREPDYKE